MMEPFQQTYILSLQIHINIFLPTFAILIMLKKLLRFRRRHVFYVSVVTQPQHSLCLMNFSIIWCVVDMDGDVHNCKFNVRQTQIETHSSTFVTLTGQCTLHYSIILAYRTSRELWRNFCLSSTLLNTWAWCFPALQLFRSHNLKIFQSNYVGPNFRCIRKKPSRVNHPKAIAASSVPPLFLLAASSAPATVEHSIVASRVQIAIRSGLCMW